MATNATPLFTDADGQQVRGAGIIPAGTVHALGASDATGLMVYLEPATPLDAPWVRSSTKDVRLLRCLDHGRRSGDIE